MTETKVNISDEEKRLKQFKEIADNWDSLPEKAQGRLEGEIAMAHALLCGGDFKKAG